MAADGSSCYIARDIRLIPRTTPVSSPQSNGIAEALAGSLKRDYVRVTVRLAGHFVLERPILNFFKAQHYRKLCLFPLDSSERRNPLRS
jgi:transposase InsO family protein